jgi:pimeloyl-ACP methyl ester carboxylesterase
MPVGLRVVGLPLLGPLLMGRPSAVAIRWELRRLTTTLPLPREREDALVAYLHACARCADRTWFARAIRRFCGPRGQREIITDAELTGLRCPTLLLWGTRDRFFPLEHGERAAERIPRSVLVTLAGVGHSPNWERPAEVAALLAAFFQR